MPDPTTTTTTTDPPAPPEPVATTPPAPPAEPPVDEWDKDRAKATILAQREEAKALKAQLSEAKKAQDRLAEIEAATLTEQEKALQRAEDAEAKAATATATLQRGYLLAELAKPEHGLVDAETAAALITDVQYDDDGRPVNLADRITALVEAKGFLKAGPTPPPAAPQINGGSGTQQVPPPNLSADEIKAAQAAGKSPEDWNALKNVQSIEDWNRLQAQKAAAKT